PVKSLLLRSFLRPMMGSLLNLYRVNDSDTSPGKQVPPPMSLPKLWSSRSTMIHVFSFISAEEKRLHSARYRTASFGIRVAPGDGASGPFPVPALLHFQKRDGSGISGKNGTSRAS